MCPLSTLIAAAKMMKPTKKKEETKTTMMMMMIWSHSLTLTSLIPSSKLSKILYARETLIMLG